MGFYTTTSVTEKPHPETPSCAHKTASGKFFTYPIKTQYKNRHNSLKTNQEKPLSTQETASGVFYYKFRHYSAELGRWLGRDPIGERGGVNLYGFVGNDPVGRWDALGLAARFAFAGIVVNSSSHTVNVRGDYFEVTVEQTIDNGDVIINGPYYPKTQNEYNNIPNIDTENHNNNWETKDKEVIIEIVLASGETTEAQPNDANPAMIDADHVTGASVTIYTDSDCDEEEDEGDLKIGWNTWTAKDCPCGKTGIYFEDD